MSFMRSSVYSEERIFVLYKGDKPVWRELWGEIKKTAYNFVSEKNKRHLYKGGTE